MFGIDFYPTPPEVIEQMMQGLDVSGLKILEPSAGSGNIVDWLLNYNAEVYTCEIDARLRAILSKKPVKMLEDDCMDLKAEQISHVNMIVMNPPFSKQENHINHLFEIAPAGCQIIALCNRSVFTNRYNDSSRIKNLVALYGTEINLGECFSNAERETDVEVALVRLQKPADNYEFEFHGFFTDEEREVETGEGIMSYNFVRDLVNRYVEALKIHDQQIESGIQLNKMISGFFGGSYGFQVIEGDKLVTRNTFKKSLQHAGWKYVLSKFNLEKISTSRLKADLNKFVENQVNVPFTMKNIYKMVDIIIGTTGSRIDRAIEDVFDWVTSLSEGGHYDWKTKQDIPKTYPNRETWKTNSHFMLTKKIIIPYAAEQSYSSGMEVRTYGSNAAEKISDFEKSLCFLTGDNFDEIPCFQYNKRASYRKEGMSYSESVGRVGTKLKPNVWYDNHHFFRYKVFKKGTLHLEFKNEDTWASFNQRISKIKGYPLFEGRTQTDFQKRQTGRKTDTVKTTPVNEWKTEKKEVPISEVLPSYDTEEFTLFE